MEIQAQDTSHCEEQMYDASVISPYGSSTSSVSSSSSSPGSLIQGVIYPDYAEWHQGNIETQRQMELPQYQSFVTYPQVSQTDLMSTSGSFWQGEVPLHPGMSNFSYSASATDRLHPQSYDYNSNVSNTTKSGKPKRKRVQSSSQRKAANIRERRRMFHLNEAFDDLRKRLPAFNYEKRLSRIETLRLAMTYISFMKDIADGEDPKSVKLQSYKEDLDDDIFKDLKENGVHLADENLNQEL